MFLWKHCKSLLYSIVISEQNKLLNLMKVNFKLHFKCQKTWSKLLDILGLHCHAIKNNSKPFGR